MGIDRKNIEDKYKWKIDLMYSSKESIEKDIEKIWRHHLSHGIYSGKESRYC